MYVFILVIDGDRILPHRNQHAEDNNRFICCWNGNYKHQFTVVRALHGPLPGCSEHVSPRNYQGCTFDINTKPPECVDIIRRHHEVFTAGALEAQSVGRMLSRHQLGEPSDVRRIIPTHVGSFVFIIQGKSNIL